MPLQNWWIQMGVPNTSMPPTDNLAFRKAVQAVLDMDEIMDAATDGNYRLNIGLQYPNQPAYTDAGKETYNQHNSVLAKKYLAESGYKGEPVVLLTNKDYSSMYNAALVMAEQLKAIGIKAELKVVDWPTSTQMAKTRDGWNYTFTGWGSETAVGALGIMQDLIPPSMQFMPKDPAGDPRHQRRLCRDDAEARPEGPPGGVGAGAADRAGTGLRAAVRRADQDAGRALERAGLHAVPHSAHVQRLVHELTRQ